MIEVETFLAREKGSYVHIRDCVTPPANPHYIEGYIRLVVNGREIMGMEEWDLVDQLWAYVSEMIHRLDREPAASISFPDQPLEFSMTRQGSRILVACGDARSNADAYELLAALRAGGLQFFDDLDRLLPEEAFRYEESRRFLTE